MLAKYARSSSVRGSREARAGGAPGVAVPISRSGYCTPSWLVIPEPQSLPYAPNRRYPSLSINATQSGGTLSGEKSSSGSLENPYPGSDGTTQWNESVATPPWATGSVSAATDGSISQMVPG